ncbi:hypothetical protein BDR06DRAFT_950810 [Suillus hirtellus]|nr:hypothetical protein BDR06DRAFT_950810 [Suillus hirtellus]
MGVAEIDDDKTATTERTVTGEKPIMCEDMIRDQKSLKEPIHRNSLTSLASNECSSFEGLLKCGCVAFDHTILAMPADCDSRAFWQFGVDPMIEDPSTDEFSPRNLHRS